MLGKRKYISILLFLLLFQFNIPTLNFASTIRNDEISRVGVPIIQRKNNLIVTWILVKQAPFIYNISIQNLLPTQRQINLTAIIDNCTFPIDKLKVKGFYEWKNVSYVIHVPDYTTILMNYTFVDVQNITILSPPVNVTIGNPNAPNYAKVVTSNMTAIIGYSKYTESRNGIWNATFYYEKQVIKGYHEETRYKLDWKPCKMQLIKKTAKVFKANMELIKLPPYGSKPKDATYNGTKWFKLEFSTPIGFNIKGRVALDINGIVFDPWFNASWQYRKSHEIIGSSAGEVTDYQIKIKVHYSSGTDLGEDVYLNEHCRTDFGDIRFTSSDGITELPYFLEEVIDWFASGAKSSPLYYHSYPSAVCYNNRTYIVFHGDADLNPYIIYYDHENKTWSPAVKVGDNPLSNDIHGAPAIAIDSEGYIHVFYGAHESSFKHVKSANPEDISSWVQKSDLVGGATYPKLIVNGSTMYLFYRYWSGSYPYTERYIKSDDDGETWSAGTDIIVPSGNRYIYVGQVAKSGSKIHLAWFLYNTDTSSRENLYHAYLDISTGHMYSADGTDLGTYIDQTEMDTYCLVDTGDIFLPALKLDANGNPHIIYCKKITNGYAFYYTKWLGSSWISPMLIKNVSDSWNEADFIIYSPDNIEAYLTSYGSSNANIEKWIWNGATWYKDSIVKNQTRYPLNHPFIPINYQPDLKLIFSEFIKGNYDIADLRVYAWGDNGFTKLDAIFWVKVPYIPTLHPKVETGTWIVDGYTYHRRTKITITENSGSDLTDYQVKVVINTKWLVDNGYVTPNGNEVRFMDSEGNLLNFWRETDFNTEETVYWVKIPNLPANTAKTIYIYYDADLTSVPDASDGEATFNYFEDFVTDVFASDEWHVAEGSTPTISDSLLILDNPTQKVYSDFNFNGYLNPCIAELKIKNYNTRLIGLTKVGLELNPFPEWIGFGDQPDNRVRAENNDDNWGTTYNLNDDAWKILQIRWRQNDVYIYVIQDGTETLLLHKTPSNGNGIPDESEEFFFYIYSGDSNPHVYVDWVRVRKYIDPEPSVEVEVEGQATIYIYYGNPSATTTSNGEETFVLFDNFDDGDISDWVQYGTPIVTSDEYVSPPYSVYCEIYEYIEKSITPISKFIFEMYGRYINTSDYYFIRLRKDEITAIRLAFRDDKLQYWDGSAYHVVLDTSINTWYKIKLIVDCEQNKYDIYVNDELKYSGADFENVVDVINNVRPIDIKTANPNPGFCDNVIIRKYIDPEPSHGVWGVEESYTGVSYQYSFDVIVGLLSSTLYRLPFVSRFVVNLLNVVSSVERFSSLVRTLFSYQLLCLSMRRVLAFSRIISNVASVSSLLSRMVMLSKPLQSQLAVKPTLYRLVFLEKQTVSLIQVFSTSSRILTSTRNLKSQQEIFSTLFRTILKYETLTSTLQPKSTLLKLASLTRKMQTQIFILSKLSSYIEIEKLLKTVMQLKDTLARPINIYRILSSPLFIQSAIQKLTLKIKTLPEKIQIDILIQKTLILSKQLKTSITLIDASLRKVYVFRVFTDTFRILSSSIQGLPILTVNLVNSINIKSTVTRAVTLSRTLQTIQYIAELISRISTNYRAITKIILIKEYLTSAKIFTLNLSEAIPISTSIKRVSTLTRMISIYLEIFTISSFSHITVTPPQHYIPITKPIIVEAPFFDIVFSKLQGFLETYLYVNIILVKGGLQDAKITFFIDGKPFCETYVFLPEAPNRFNYILTLDNTIIGYHEITTVIQPMTVGESYTTSTTIFAFPYIYLFVIVILLTILYFAIRVKSKL